MSLAANNFIVKVIGYEVVPQTNEVLLHGQSVIDGTSVTIRSGDNPNKYPSAKSISEISQPKSSGHKDNVNYVPVDGNVLVGQVISNNNGEITANYVVPLLKKPGVESVVAVSAKVSNRPIPYESKSDPKTVKHFIPVTVLDKRASNVTDLRSLEAAIISALDNSSGLAHECITGKRGALIRAVRLSDGFAQSTEVHSSFDKAANRFLTGQEALNKFKSLPPAEGYSTNQWERILNTIKGSGFSELAVEVIGFTRIGYNIFDNRQSDSVKGNPALLEKAESEYSKRLGYAKKRDISVVKVGNNEYLGYRNMALVIQNGHGYESKVVRHGLLDFEKPSIHGLVGEHNITLNNAPLAHGESEKNGVGYQTLNDSYPDYSTILELDDISLSQYEELFRKRLESIGYADTLSERAVHHHPKAVSN